DVLSAIDFAKKKPYVKNISIFGTSFGGVCALLAASRYKKIKSLGLKAPASDMGYNRKQKLGDEGYKEWKKIGIAEFTNNDGKKVMLKYSFMEDAENIDAFEEAKNILCPTLIVHGDKDLSVPLEQSKKLEKSINGVKLEIIAGANHHFDRSGEKERVNSRFVDFFKEVLK
ncbi:alpha/beta hydrolase, partial [candidate division KSB1 bacterium]